MTAPDSERNDDIEALRAVSIVYVLYEHFGTLHYSPTLRLMRMMFTGWTGVDLFFCISGFVIYRSLSATLHYGDSAPAAARQIMAFWIRRFWRLAPTAWLWLLIAVPAGLDFGSGRSGSYYQHITSIVASLLNIENIHRYVCAVHDTPCGTILIQFWSLSLEVQFYLALPFAMLLLPRRWLAAAMVALIVVQFAWPREPFAHSLAWYLRTDAIAWGILLAIGLQGRLGEVLRPAFLASAPAPAAYTLGLLGLLGCSKLFDAEDIFTGIAGVLAAGLVWAAAYNCGYIWRPAWAVDLLRWVGLRSYSLYACHLIVFRLVKLALYGLDGSLGGLWLHGIAAYALTVLAAALTYRYVERPLRRRGREAAQRYLRATEAAMAAPPAG